MTIQTKKVSTLSMLQPKVGNVIALGERYGRISSRIVNFRVLKVNLLKKWRLIDGRTMVTFKMTGERIK